MGNKTEFPVSWHVVGLSIPFLVAVWIPLGSNVGYAASSPSLGCPAQNWFTPMCSRSNIVTGATCRIWIMLHWEIPNPPRPAQEVDKCNPELRNVVGVGEGQGIPQFPSPRGFHCPPAAARRGKGSCGGRKRDWDSDFTRHPVPVWPDPIPLGVLSSQERLFLGMAAVKVALRSRGRASPFSNLLPPGQAGSAIF